MVQSIHIEEIPHGFPDYLRILQNKNLKRYCSRLQRTPIQVHTYLQFHPHLVPAPANERQRFSLPFSQVERQLTSPAHRSRPLEIAPFPRGEETQNSEAAGPKLPPYPSLTEFSS